MPLTPTSSRSSSPTPPERSEAAAAPVKKGSMEGKRDVSPKKETPETAKVTQATKPAIGKEAITFERKRGEAPKMSEAQREANRAFREAKNQAQEKKKLREPSEDTLSITSAGSDPDRVSSAPDHINSDLLGPSPSSPMVASQPKAAAHLTSKSDESLSKVRSRTLGREVDMAPKPTAGATVAIPLRGGRKNLYRDQEVKKEVDLALTDYQDFKTKAKVDLGAIREEDEPLSDEEDVKIAPQAAATAAPEKPKEAVRAPISFGGNRRGGPQMTKEMSDANKAFKAKAEAARLARGENPSAARKPTTSSNLTPIAREEDEE